MKIKISKSKWQQIGKEILMSQFIPHLKEGGLLAKHVKISKSKWQQIGKKQGWLKQSQLANPQQAQQHLEQLQQLNQRQQQLILTHNKIFNQNVPVTVDGYNQLGRSEGIVQAIANDPQAFYTFINSQPNSNAYSVVRDIFNQIPQ